MTYSARPGEGVFALTPLQEGMLFHTLLAPGAGAYFSQHAFTLRGPVDTAALWRAWQAAVDRHPALRTAFVWDGVEHPVQEVHDAAELPWTELDWRGDDPAGRAERLAELRAADRARGFDLHAPPLLRVTLVRMEDDEWEATWSHHHLLLDGWSSPLVLRDVFTAYGACAGGAPPALPPAPPYAGYLRWLRARGEDGEDGAEAFWREALAGFAAPTPLGTGRTDGAAGQATETVRCTPVLTAALRSMARRHRLTLNTLVQGAWAILLARRAGERDVVFGGTVSGRPAELPGVEEMVGLFINTLPVRARVDADAPLIPWLAELQERQARVREHEHTPLARVREWSDVPRGAPLFESILVFENFPVDEVLAGLDLPFEVEGWVSHEQTDFPLTVVALPGARLALRATYDRARLDGDTVRRMLAQLRMLLEGMPAEGDVRLGDLSWMDAAEREQVVRGWNATASAYPRASTIPALFAEQAARAPGRIALSLGGETMTYAELDARANRLARVLRARGVGPESRVGVALDRSLDLPVALLAILKAGGAYVPLDPSYPAERLAFMRRDAGVSLVVTRATGFAAAGDETTIFDLEEERGAIDAASADGFDGTAADSLAYVIYTSGSTGTPKGVAVPHRGVLRLVRGSTFASLAEDETFLQLAPVAFDASTFEIWGPLLNGGRLALYPAEKPELEGIERAIRGEGVTTLWLTAGLFHLAADERMGMFAGLRQLLAGGDVLSPAHVRRVRKAHPHLRLINGYGPTESTTFTACHTVRDADLDGTRPIPLGAPIANTRVYVVDAELAPVPVGVPGELLIGGDGLARGYLGRPALTAETFVPDPFATEPGGRLYRTGDRACWRDGVLDFMGRIDQQVKVRGFRIEPGEVEAALLADPAVREAIVIVREDLPGDRRLVGYVTGDAPDAEALRARLRGSLPEHMVPAAVVVLDALPLTANGKVDRRALPAPEHAAEPYVAPRTEAERRMAAIWSDVLGVERVGVNDGFVGLGGHSLLATRLISRVRGAFGVDLPLRALFDAPTVAALAERLESEAETEAAGDAIPVLPRDGRPLPVSFSQRRLWFIDQLEPGSAAYNVPGAYRVRGGLDADVLERVLGEVVRRHEALRTVFAAVDGEPVQVVARPGTFALERIDLSDLPEAEREDAVRRMVAEEAARPFDLARGPLFRAAVLRLDADDHVFLATMHHVVSDGWSVGVLAREAAALYAAFSAGAQSPLAPLPIQYADYAAWQRDALRGERLDAQVAWWRRTLAGAPPRLELPADHPRTAAPSPEGAVRRVALGAEATRALRALARREGATLFMALTAAFQALLARWSGEEDVSIGTPVAGRGRTEVEGLIGFFVNTLVLRTDVSGDPDFRALLGRVRESVLGAHAHQDVPFEKLVEELRPPRELGETPFFQAMFSLREQEAAPALGALSVAALEDDAAPAKFDLEVVAVDEGERLAFSFGYRARLREAETIDRMAGHFTALLEHVAAHPEAPVFDAPLLDEGERARLAAWNDTARPCPAATLHGLFEAQAARTPHAVALVAGDAELTYAELDAHSAQVARRLRARGVTAETRVGVLLERGPELLPALLGILRAGGAYVPLDPAYPAERLALTLEDAAAPVLLTESRLLHLLPPFAGRVECVDEAWDAEDPVFTPAVALPGSTAYLIYTSGSTGRPKGVQIEHRSAAAFLHWAMEAFPADELAGVLASTSICFDLSVYELFLPLAVGTTVILAENALALPDLPARDRVTLLNTVPSAAAELVRAGGIPSTLRVVNLAGEPLPRALADSLYGLRHVEKVWDLYGPSEDTTYSTGAVVRRDDVRAPGIGRAIANTRAHLLDARLRPVPVGVVGELCLSGDGLARGYLGRPALTAEKFVPDPFSAAGGRMYCTGDRARWGRDGELEFLGRIDHQVKVRGFRIEPGEVETVLARHPAVRAALVMAREDVLGDRRLVAYVTGGASADEMRAHLRGSLPEHMVPSAFVVLDEFPLTPNGKTDRKALPAPETSGDAAAYVAPRTPAEQVLAEIWAGVLGVDRVGATDSFFALGGHSLLATRVISRVREALGADLPLRALFEAPTVAALAARLDGAAPAGADPIRPLPRDGTPLPLSFAQRRLWFIDQMEPGSSAYNLPSALRIRGPLDVAVLERVLGEVVRRHEALRTVFAAVDGEPVQTVAGPGAFALERIDRSDLPEAEREDAVRRRVAEEAARGFDLARGPLFRAAVLRLDADDHVLLATMHHAVSDGWSIGVLVREAAALYAAFSAGAESPLAPLPLQYADYAAWQRETLRGERLDAQVAWWRQALAGAPPRLELPADHPRTPTPSPEGATHRVELGAEATRALRALARREGATLFMALTAAFQALLSRWSGEEDVSIGTPVAGRGRTEVEGLIGFFANTLVLRTDVSGDPDFRALLGRVRDGVLGAHAHQEVPFEKLVEELRPPRELGETPFFQAMFSLREQEAAPALGTLSVVPLEDAAAPARFDLDVVATDQGERLAFSFHYRARLWEAETIGRMAGHFTTLLEHVAARPEAPVFDAPLLGEGERARIAAWNDTASVYAPASVHGLFEAQAARTPDAVALVAGGAELTYAQLDARATAVARRLRGLGVGTETRVGVLLERGPELLPALLGILKAGGAYVPLDPAYPADRLAFILEDAGAPVLLTERRLLSTAPAFAGAVVCVDEDGPAAAGDAGFPAVLPENAAYLIYTSGSTGRPKGVQIEHRSVVAFVHWAMGVFPAGELAGVLASTSICFDISVFELYVPLAVGTTVILAENALALPDLPARDRVTLLNTVPSAAAELVRAGGIPSTVRVVNLCGEPLPRTLADAIHAVPHVETLWNLYGPSEDTVYSTFAVAARGGVRAPGIGRAIANTRAHLLDARLRPVPIGVAGELCLSGDGLARGYLGRPALTAEKFVPDPFSAAGGRMYRTGDRARWGRDGELEFLGRIDHQVKVRGFRIEPGEVETVLARHPAVRAALVMAREDVPGDRRLVAYVTGDATADEMRAHLRGTLPEHMVPSAFVVLDEFPLTPNGKTDRKALPAPETSGDAAAYLAPRTPAEQVLAEIWAGVLGVDRVGAKDSFFALGGHSLLATRVISRVREALGADLPLRALFEAPTVAALAARLDGAAPADADPIRPIPRDGTPLPLSFAQRRLWFIDQMEPGSDAYHIAATLRIRGPLDADALERAIAEVVRRHEALRTVFAAADGEPVQVVKHDAAFRLARRELDAGANDAEAEVRRLAAEEAGRSFNLRRGPLLRATLLRAADDDHALLFTLHHIVSDGWSLEVLVREASALYAAFAAGEAPPPAELPVQYADYAAWQHAWLAGGVMEAQLAYWRGRLAGAPPLLELPADHPRPAVAGRAGATHAFVLPPRATRALRALARAEGATLYMAVLAAFQALLSRWSGSQDVSVGTPVAGRGRLETEALIGLFVNTLVVRTDLSGGPDYRALLRRVRDGVLGAHAHQDLPFERLVDALQVERTLAHAPLFQVMFALDDGRAPEPRLGAARVETVETPLATARWDLALHAQPSEDDGLRVLLTYRTDLFTAANVARLAAHFAALAEAAADRPDLPVARLALLEEEEREQVVRGWNATASAYPRTSTIPALFAEQAARAPGRIALALAGETMTYGELDARANRLARVLRARGVGPESRVGVALDRSLDLPVALLAILKAGGAYVPLDPSYPAERLAFMRRDAGVSLVITRSTGFAAAGDETTIFDLEEERGAIDAASADGFDGTAADSLAYVIYTSGSTGTPKGVAVPHRGVLRLVRGSTFASLAEDETFLQLAPVAFDASTFEIWGPLLNGGRLALYPAEKPELEGIERAIRGEGVTTLWLTAGLFHLAADERMGMFAGLRQLLAGGDVLSPAHVRRVREAHPQLRLINGYGPTESTTFAACHTVRDGDLDGARPIPLGAPIANTRVHVVDAELAPAPIGVPGELLIGGDGLARGYLGRPALTAETFIPDPFSTEPGGRLYRTGDRVRWRVDGVLDFMGRIDQQVKVRGFRIEPGEVEAALLADPAVHEATVIIREDLPGDGKLVAYVTGDAPDAEGLRARLRARLPEYMIPAAVVALDALPLTPNGKVDRRALPAPETGGDADAYVAPATPLEARLAEVWAGVLGVERVGIHDNFFEAGGDSILSIQLVSRARRAGVEITPRQVFEHPTVAGLARVAREAAHPRAEQGPVTGTAPLTPVQRWFFAQELPEPHHWTMPVLLAPRERLAPDALRAALQALDDHHDALRLRYVRGADGAWTQAHAPTGAELPLDVVDLAAAADAAAEIERRGTEAQRALRLDDGPLARATLFRLADGSQRLLLAVHHLVVDGVSWRVLLEDLEAAYRQAEAGAAIALPEKTASFRAWSRLLAGHAAAGGFDGERAYWTGVESAAVPSLPRDARGENTEASAEQVTVALDAAETRALLQEVPAAYRTRVNDVLLAALARAFAGWTGERRLRVLLEGHGREELFPGVDLSRTAGWFTAMYPVLLEAGAGDPPGDALKAVKETLRAVPGHGIGYGALRWPAEGEAALPDAPAPEVAFNYLGQVSSSSPATRSLFGFADEGAGATRAPDAARPWVIGVDALVEDGALRAQWTYSRALHRRETVERVAQAFVAELRALAAHCRDPRAGGCTPSDFPLAAAGQAELDAVAGTGRDVEDVLPLAPMQEGMLFETLYGGPEAYLGQFGFTLRGAVSVDAFRAAWQGVVDRHGALRARFAWHGLERPLQVVVRGAAVPFAFEDLRALDPARRQARIADYVAEDRAAGFDLGAAPLLRLALFRTGDDEHRVVWTHHHLVLDGWSLRRVYGDVLALYQAALAGTEARLPAPPAYRDYLAWLGRQDAAASEAFWRAELDGFHTATPLEMPGPGPRPAPGWGHAHADLDPALVAGLQALGRRHGVTVNTLVQGAWALLVSRCAGERDVVFGTTVAGRPAALEGMEDAVGLFINTVPVRVDVDPDAAVLPWLRRLQAGHARLREHEHAPLARVQRWSAVPAGEPLFESFVSFQNYPVDPAAAEGPFTVAEVWAEERAGYPLSLNVSPGAASLRLDLHYERARFAEAAMARLPALLATLLAGFVAVPDAPLADVPLLSPGERAAVLRAGTGPAEPYPAVPVHALIKERAALWPDAAAAVCGAEQLTYAGLHARADRLAAVLRGMGVGPEVAVALYLDRSLDLAVALLAVLRAGGFYVPVDPAYPAERIAFLLEDSAAPVLLTRGALADALPPHAARVVRVDALDPAEPGAPPMPAVEVDPDALAYAIYTSGSTGRPKAAMISHRSLVCYAEAMAADLALGTTDRFLQFASPSFDVMVEEIFPAWLAGAAVVFPERELLGAPEELERVIAGQGITRLEVPTAFWHEWARGLAEEGGRLPECVRTVIVGGERVLADRLRAWAAVGVPLVHVFGLTETSVTSTTLRIPAGEDASARWSNLPVGRPLPNVRIHVLDGRMEPVPAGVAGELFIGGDGVARGYRGRPALTAERYVPDPLAAAPGARLYRTGDRVRWLDDGTLEFLGRTDHQVKIRGFRIEPAEIQAALATHPAVREAAVIVREDVPGDRRLVAYLSPAAGYAAAPGALLREGGDGARVGVDELRAHLAGTLPPYMVPSAVVVLPALPLTPNGKVDRRGLPRPDAAALPAEADYEAPRTPAEAALARVWAEVLGVERVGIHDDFFMAGGDSILSIQIVSRARRAGVEVTPRQLFEHRTVAALARVAGTAAAVLAEQGEVAGPAPLTPIQRWFFGQALPDPHHWNMPVLLAPRDRLDAAPLRRALDALVRHHDALRLRFRRGDDGGWTQEHAPAGAPVPLDEADFSALAPQARAAELERRAAALQRALDLGRGPLLRAALFDLGEAGQRLLIAVHHLVVDGVSWRALLEDLETAYDAAAGGGSVVLPAKTTSFREWAGRLAAHAERGGFDGERPYWAAIAALPVPPLPVDFPGGADTEESAEQLTVSLAADETRALLHDVPAAYRTQVNDVLLTALARAFAGWTGEGRMRVELEGHGREELFPGVDLSRTVGWFTTLYPVVLEAGEAEHPGEALKAVKEALRAVPAHGIGHGALRWLAPDAPEAEPAPEVRFEYLGQLDGTVSSAARFALADEEVGAPVAPGGRRSHRLVVGGAVVEGALRTSWTYSRALHRRETIQRLADGFLAELRALLGHCARVGSGGCTPSDFPLARLDGAAVDRLAGNGRGVEDLLPLSPMQEGMLFHTLYSPGDGSYVGQIAFDLEGPLDADAFGRAWTDVAERHSALRAAFAWEAGSPVQVVRRGVSVPVRTLDWRGLDPAEREAQREAWLREDRARGFDPAAAPLMRLLLARTGDDAWWAAWSFHQMVLDGWSLPLVFGDVAAAYAARAAGHAPAPSRARPYRDYLAWLAGRDRGAADAFWRGEMEGFRAPTPLPGDRGARAAHGAEGYVMRELRLSEARHDGLRAFCRAHGLTVNTLLQGAWALLLSRHAREAEVLFGVTVSGRPPELEGVEEMVGLFINTLPLRVQVDPASPALPWLRALQARQAAVREHGEAPLSRVQGWSGVPRGQPLFESLVLFENYPAGHGLDALAGVRVRSIASREQSNLPLSLVALPGAGLSLTVRYDASRFHAAPMDALVRQLDVVLAGLVEHPERALRDLPLLDEAERTRMLQAWNATDAPYAALPIHALVRAQAERTPFATAVTARGESLAYAELDARADGLARHLAGVGVRRGSVVAISMERSAGLLVALLAVWKAGAAYVPVDPAYPEDRRAYMLADSAAAFVLTDAASAAGLPPTGAAVVVADRVDPSVEAKAEPWHDVRVDADDLAYVIYTSGSTGRPKGVMVPHRGVASFLASMARAPGMAADDVLVALTSLSFDIAVLELLLPLVAGARVVIATREEAMDADRLARLLRTEGATVMQATPATWRMLVQGGWEGEPRLAILSGGEALQPDLARELLPRGRALWNLYGPTETTIWSAVDRVECAEGITLGHAIANTRLYVLDDALRPCPAGVPGELFIGGTGVVRGYLRRPSLTAERFVPDPFGAPGTRLYRTGDLARRTADGALEFLGRTDFQVKVRGFRIELGEIEARLAEHPAVRQAVAAVREDVPGDRRLAAYLVCGDGALPAPAELRAWLLGRLPDYMVPSAFVGLDALPLTANGKLDRRALPAPDPAPPGDAYVAPETDAERVLAGVWASVLGRERVGVADNFFEAGGDSILSIQVVAEARREGLEITPRLIFENPTVAALARVARRGGGVHAEQGPVTGAVPLTPVQRRFFDLPVPRRHHWNQSLLLVPRAPLDGAALERAATALVRHHDALRLRFTQGADGAWTQAHGPADETAAVPYRDLGALPPAERAEALEARATEVQASLDLSAGPIVRFARFGMGDDGERLLVAVHHLAVDGVSWRILLQDLETAYGQAARGESIVLPPKTVAFGHWAERLAEHAATPAAEAELAFWARAEGGAAPLPAELPADFPGGSNATEHGRAVTVALEPGETEALLRHVPAAYHTRTDDALLAALAQAVDDWTGDGRLWVTVEGHGREAPFEDVDLSRTVGWFTAPYPVLLQPGRGGPGEAIQAVKEQLRAVPAGGMGHGVLRWMGGDDARRALAALPAPQVSFHYRGQLDGGGADGGFFAAAPEPGGCAAGPGGTRDALLQVDARVEGGRLVVTLGYGGRVHREGTVRRLADGCLRRLRALIAHCAREDAGGHTPSDFPLAGIDAATLALLEADALDDEMDWDDELDLDLDLDPAGA